MSDFQTRPLFKNLRFPESKGPSSLRLTVLLTAIGRRVVVVRAFVKKTQKTPRIEIELALRRAKEIT